MVESSNRNYSIKALIVTAFIALAVIALFLLWHLANMLLVIFAGILLAVFLDGLTMIVNRRLKLARYITLTLVVALLLILAVGVGYLFGPRLTDQFARLAERIPEALDSISASLAEDTTLSRWITNLPAGNDLLTAGSTVLGGITGVFSTVLGFVTSLLIILFIGIYLASAPQVYVRNSLRLVPKKRRERAGEVIAAMGKALRWWLVGRFASMFVVGLLTALGVWIAGIPLALTLGLIAALLSFVPIIGPVLTAIPLTLVALAEEPVLAIWAIVIYLIVQTLETYLITPLIQRKAVSIPPAVLISAQTVMGVLFGILGIFLATPFAVVVIVAVQTLYIQDVLNEDTVVMGVHTAPTED
jgi:predicted PurR-regulated permease PerM